MPALAPVLNLEPHRGIATWQNNINQATSGMQVTQAMTQIQQIAATLAQTGNLEAPMFSGTARRAPGAGAGRTDNESTRSAGR